MVRNGKRIMLTFSPRRINFGLLDGVGIEVRDMHLTHTGGCAPSPHQVQLIRDRRAQKIPEEILESFHAFVAARGDSRTLKCVSPSVPYPLFLTVHAFQDHALPEAAKVRCDTNVFVEFSPSRPAPCGRGSRRGLCCVGVHVGGSRSIVHAP